MRRPFSCLPPCAAASTNAWFSMARARSSTSQWALPVVQVNAAGTSYGPDSTFTTTMLAQTITFDALSSRTYGTDHVRLAATASSGLPVGYASANEAAVRISNDTAYLLAADTATITASQAGDGNYQTANSVFRILTITRKPLIIADATAQNKTYDGTTDATVTGAHLDGVVNSDDVSLSLGNATFATKDTGTAKSVTVTGSILTGAKAGNYSLTEVSGLVADISAHPITVTAQANSKIEGSNDPVLSYKASSLVGSDAWSGALARDPGEDPGDYPIRQGTLSAGDNYDITFVGADLTISRVSALGSRPQKRPTSVELGVKVDRVFASMANGAAAASLGEANCTDATHCQSLDVVLPEPSRISVAIFDNMGTLVIAFQERIDGSAFQRLRPTLDGRKIFSLAWNLRSAKGVAVQPGVFLWKIEVLTDDGRKLETVKRLGVK